MAALVGFLDAVLRLPATNAPALLPLHYAGRADGAPAEWSGWPLSRQTWPSECIRPLLVCGPGLCRLRLQARDSSSSQAATLPPRDLLLTTTQACRARLRSTSPSSKRRRSADCCAAPSWRWRAHASSTTSAARACRCLPLLATPPCHPSLPSSRQTSPPMRCLRYVPPHARGAFTGPGSALLTSRPAATCCC